jgi:hypothetical protein
MVHIYANQNAEVAKRQRRRIVIQEINILRKFEGKQMIEDRIARQMDKLHTLWFGPNPEMKKSGESKQS